MKVCFETFGCRLNRAEALDQEARYVAAGWTVTARHDDADLIVVRGCSVTQKAQAECEKVIRHIRRKYPNVRLHIQGCLRERGHDRDPGMGKSGDDVTVRQAVPTRTARAYLKIQDGCSGKCTFCIVPKFRGSPKSVPFADLLDRARRMMEAGYHEIVVTGCNLALYASGEKRLPDLLAALADLGEPYFCRIRLGSVEPGSCADEVVNAISEHINICHFLHLPIQSGSDRILKLMKRPYTLKHIEQTVSLALKLMPFVGLGCDLMTGFPGEDDIDFYATVGLMNRYPFSNAHIFPFSPRPGTPAAIFPLQVPPDVSIRRARELSHRIKENRRNYARKFIGFDVETVIERDENLSGWAGEYLPVIPSSTLPSIAPPQRKDLVIVHVTEVHGDTLRGVITTGSRTRG